MDTKSLDEVRTHTLPGSTTEIFDITVPGASALSDVDDSADVYDEDGYSVEPKPVPGYKSMFYMPFGCNDELPYRLIHDISGDEVLSQNLFFNVLTAYGAGLEYMNRSTGKPTEDPEIERFLMSNSAKSFYLEQCTDMKYFFFTVAVVILSRDYSSIVKVVHKDAGYCRFEKADHRGRINHVFYANWRKNTLAASDVEVLTLLDERDPLGHLNVLVGREPDGKGVCRRRTNEHKFAVVMRFPTPGQRYYPRPYYTALFRGDWYDLKRLIGKAKKAKIRNHAPVKYQVEIHRDYWENIIEEENITDPVKIKARIILEKQKIRDFVTGSENSGKVWISQYYVDSYGKEQRMVRINRIDTSKEGGDWAEDIQETSNMLCYGTNIHPNLVGATPGKSQSNNSGSDKRELFTLKQAIETAFHDTLLKVHRLIIFYNGWERKVRPQVPMILLTTLDQKTDAKKVTGNDTTTDVND